MHRLYEILDIPGKKFEFCNCQDNRIYMVAYKGEEKYIVDTKSGGIFDPERFCMMNELVEEV